MRPPSPSSSATTSGENGSLGTLSLWGNRTILDGDTFRIGQLRYRLLHADAPELPNHCTPPRQCTPGDPYQARAVFTNLLSDPTTSCSTHGLDHYKRILITCSNSNGDVERQLVAQSDAVMRY